MVPLAVTLKPAKSEVQGGFVEANGLASAPLRECNARIVVAASALADLRLALELLDQGGQRNGRQRFYPQGPARREIHG